MRSLVTAVVAAIEAIATAFAAALVIVIPAIVLWAVTFSLAAEPQALIGAIAGVWLLAHGVPLEFGFTAEQALNLGLAPEAVSFTLSIMPLGITLISLALAARGGWRFGARGGSGAAGILGGGIGFAGAAAVMAVLATGFTAWPLIGATLLPAALYMLSSATAFVIRAARDEQAWWAACVRWLLHTGTGWGIPNIAGVRPFAAVAWRLTGALLLGSFALGAVGFAGALLTGYGDVIALTQSLQLDLIGSIVLFLIQLVCVPIGVIWSLAWLSGGGFSVGTGTSVSSFETLLGPVPALPIFGAIPEGWGAFGAVGPAIVVLLGVALGVGAARATVLRRAGWIATVLVCVKSAILTGVVVAGAAFFSGGSLGPGRLADVGPDPLVTGALVAAELLAGLLLGSLTSRVDLARIRAAMPSEVPGTSRLRELRDRSTVTEAPGNLLDSPAAEPAGKDVWEGTRQTDTDQNSALDEPQETQPLRSASTRPPAPWWTGGGAAQVGSAVPNAADGAEAGADAASQAGSGAEATDVLHAENDASWAETGAVLEGDEATLVREEVWGAGADSRTAAEVEAELAEAAPADTDADADADAEAPHWDADVNESAAQTAAEPELDEEALIRAFSWDGGNASLHEPGTQDPIRASSTAVDPDTGAADEQDPDDSGRRSWRKPRSWR